VAIGDDLWELGDLPGAAAAYREAKLEAAVTYAADPESVPALRQVGVVEQRLGDAGAEVGDWPAALGHHEASLAVDRELAARFAGNGPADAEIRRDLGTDLSRLGVDYAALGRPTEALGQHREATALREALLAEEPEDARALEDAAESRFEAGRALAALDRNDEAAAEIEIAIDRRRALVRLDPDNVRWQDSLADGLRTLGEIEVRRGRSQSAARAYDEAIAIRRRLALASPDFAANHAALAVLEASPSPAASRPSGR
jgi:tetratricopeptide (TPR) repeat protein